MVVFWHRKHRVIVRNMENFKFECEEGNVNVVRAFAQGGVCEKVDAMVWACEKGSLKWCKRWSRAMRWRETSKRSSTEGKNSSGESARPIDVAATGLKFEIVVYLAGKVYAKSLHSTGPRVRNSRLDLLVKVDRKA